MIRLPERLIFSPENNKAAKELKTIFEKWPANVTINCVGVDQWGIPVDKVVFSRSLPDIISKNDRVIYLTGIFGMVACKMWKQKNLERFPSIQIVSIK